MLVKVCGLTTEDDARHAVELGADALGFNLYPGSPRYIDPARAEDIAAALDSGVTRVAVVVIGDDGSFPDIPSVFDVVQVHGATDPAQLESIDREVWVAVPPERKRDFSGYKIVIDPSLGRGVQADWEELGSFRERPFILAGGLRPDNVLEAIRTARPAGVDVCSGVEESPGKKDSVKMKSFIEAVKSDRRGE